jgi:outer membrane lipoprotein-sorting protein
MKWRRMNNFHKTILFLLVLGAGASRIWADSANNVLTVDDILQKVDDAQTKAQDVQMDLTMEMKDPLSGKTQQVQGAVKMKSPNEIYVHYFKPTEQFLYITGTLAQMYQPAQHLVYQQTSPNGANEPLYLGVGKELKRYAGSSHVSIVENSGDRVVLLFIPKADDASFTSMKVTIPKKNWWPTQMEVETPSVDTQAKFSNFLFNQGIDEKQFQFTQPKDADKVEGAIF